MVSAAVSALCRAVTAIATGTGGTATGTGGTATNETATPGTTPSPTPPNGTGLGVQRAPRQVANATNGVTNATKEVANATGVSTLGDKLDPATILAAVGVLLVAYVLSRVTSVVLNALANRLVTRRFRITLVIPLAKFCIYGVAAYVVTSMLFELTTTQLVAFSGLLGAALGLGLKDLLADVFGGVVLVAEQPYQIGDKISIGDYYGEVVSIGVRSTKLVTPNDTLVTVPNYLCFDESIANANAGNAEMLVVVEFYVDPSADTRTGRRIVEDALLTSKYVYVTDDLPVQVFVEDDLHYRTIYGKAYVNDLRNEIPFKDDVNDRVLTEFARRGIESPAIPATGGELGDGAD